MTQLILRKARVIDPQSPDHLKTRDILVSGTKIDQVDEQINASGEFMEINAEGACITPGWMDFRANFRDPGHEYKEDLVSGSRAAAAGGFTAVALLPETDPVIQSKSEVEYLRSASGRLPVDLWPLAAMTRDLNGEEITEMFDMKNSGAIAFSNGNKPLKAGTMQRALLYSRGFDALLCVHPADSSLSNGAQMHEGYHSTLLGLKGMPPHAETIVVQRDLELLRYTGGRLHFSHLSAADSVELIRQAKKEGLKVSCDVAVHQLLFEDAHLETYDTNFKVFPPLRDTANRKALIAAVLDGTIDLVVSDHHPEDAEHKEVEFEYAAFGMSSIQTVLPVLLRAIPEISDERVHELLCAAPRRLAGLPCPSIQSGEEANFTVYDRQARWTLTRVSNKSRSVYTPLMGEELGGKVLGTYYKGKWNQA